MRLIRGLLLVLGAFALLAGCTPLGVLNALVLARDYDERPNLRYGELPRQQLDVYQPHGAPIPAPVVIFFYGGRWQTGSKSDYRFVGEALASKGFVAVLPDYRLYPEVKFPVFVEDAALSVRWVHDHAASFGGDPQRIYLMGHSAGAHIAALLNLDEHYLRAVGMDPHGIRAMAGLAGPYDFLPFEDADLRALFGPPQGWPSTQPINFVDGTEPPMLLLQGEADTTVKPRNATSLAAKIRQAGGSVKVVMYPNLNHWSILLALAAPFRGLAPVLGDVTAFFRRH